MNYLLTISILLIIIFLYTSIFTYKEVVEGYQSPLPFGSGCSLATIGGNPVYLCKTEEDASTQLSIDITSRVCYTSLLLKPYMYTCYDTRGDMVFDETIGTYRKFDPILDVDLMPIYGEQDSNMNDIGFNTSYNSFMPSYINVNLLQGSVNTVGNKNLTTIKNNLATLKTQYCTGTIAQKYVKACENVNQTQTKIQEIMDDKSDSSIFNINTTITNSRDTIKNAVYNKLLPSFYNTGVMNKEQRDNYILNANK